MATEYSKKPAILVNGQVLAEAADINFDYDSNDSPVKTIQKGLSGFTDGSGEVKISIDSPIPIAGLEFDFNAMIDSHRTVQVAFRMGGMQHECEGRFLNSSMAGGVDKTNMIKVSFHGKKLSSIAVG